MMATLTLLTLFPEVAGNIKQCQWCNRELPPSAWLYLAQGPSGAKYLICGWCSNDAVWPDRDAVSETPSPETDPGTVPVEPETGSCRKPPG